MRYLRRVFGDALGLMRVISLYTEYTEKPGKSQPKYHHPQRFLSKLLPGIATPKAKSSRKEGGHRLTRNDTVF
ncbi:hypothetical protein [Nostoc sp.]|uniref:hypothetical protein n=1 Tax=Nostoc sp. TaxID=1180 RepID=UPI002FFC725A